MPDLKRGERRREAILAFMQNYQREHRDGATLIQIADGVGLSGRDPVLWHVKRLVARGLAITNGLSARQWRRYIAPPGGVPFGATSCEIDPRGGRYIFSMERP